MANHDVFLMFILSQLDPRFAQVENTEWDKCSLSCGGGVQRTIGMRKETRICNTVSCPGDAGCMTVHYTFDALMAGQIYDTSKNRNHGKIIGNVSLDGNGKFAKCIHVPKHSSVSFGSKDFHNRPSSAITIALWVKLESTVGSHDVFHTSSSDEHDGTVQYHLEVNDGLVRWCHRDHMRRTVFNVISEASVPLATWTHIVATYRTSTQMAKIYLDGNNARLIKNSQLTKFGENAKVYDLSSDWSCASIGDYKSERSLEGYLDDFFIFKCELIASEVTELYETGSFKRHKIPVQ